MSSTFYSVPSMVIRILSNSLLIQSCPILMSSIVRSVCLCYRRLFWNLYFHFPSPGCVQVDSEVKTTEPKKRKQ